MAVEKPWIKNSMIALCVSLLLLTLTQIGLSLTLNMVNSPTWGVLLRATSSVSQTQSTLAAYSALILPGIELANMAVVLTPTIWLGFAAATSRHRGVYIMATVLGCLSLLSVIGFIATEAWAFSIGGYFASNSWLQGMTIAKLVLWVLIILFMVAYACVVIAGACMRSRRRRHQAPNYYNGPMMASYPPAPEYRLQQYQQQQPKYLTPSPPTPARQFDYGYPSPRGYYKV